MKWVFLGLGVIAAAIVAFVVFMAYLYRRVEE